MPASTLTRECIEKEYDIQKCIGSICNSMSLYDIRHGQLPEFMAFTNIAIYDDIPIESHESTASLIAMRHINKLHAADDATSKDELFNMEFNPYIIGDPLFIPFIRRNPDVINHSLDKYFHEFRYGSIV